jgi:hypothetical protein
MQVLDDVIHLSRLVSGEHVDNPCKLLGSCPVDVAPLQGKILRIII